MNKTFTLSLFVIGAISSIFQSCSETGPGGITRSQQPYDLESQALHPQFRLYHASEDRTELHYSINTAELLYARVNPDEPFRSNALLSAYLYSGKTLIDSISRIIADTNETRLAKLLKGRLEFNLADSVSGTVKIRFEDRLKGLAAEQVLEFNKSQKFDGANFLPMDQESGEVIFGNSVVEGRKVMIHHRDPLQQNFSFRVYFDKNDLPPPPFYYYNPNPLDKLEMINSGELKANNGTFSVQCDLGYFLISVKGHEDQGMGLQVRHPDFPRITRLSEMILSIRFITSKSEYEDIATSKEAKQKMDDFWMDCGGSAEKARDLIRIYYSRVEEANTFFSCQIEGWKSDRGLIHIVYGNPTRVVRKPGYETWIYGEENNLNTLSFTFKEVENSISSNYYVLLRDPIYKSSWSRAVDSWRNGRIYND